MTPLVQVILVQVPIVSNSTCTPEYTIVDTISIGLDMDIPLLLSIAMNDITNNLHCSFSNVGKIKMIFNWLKIVSATILEWVIYKVTNIETKLTVLVYFYYILRAWNIIPEIWEVFSCRSVCAQWHWAFFLFMLEMLLLLNKYCHKLYIMCLNFYQCIPQTWNKCLIREVF